jgi:hypothetical protein
VVVDLSSMTNQTIKLGGGLRQVYLLGFFFLKKKTFQFLGLQSLFLYSKFGLSFGVFNLTGL